MALAAVLFGSRAMAGQTQLTLPGDEINQLLAAYQMIKQGYVGQVDEKKLLQDAISGMVGSLDPHSAYLRKDELEDLLQHSSGDFVGIGVEIEVDKGEMRVVSVIEGSPADRAGMHPSDLILRIDGTLVGGLAEHQVAKLMRGAPESALTIDLVRSGRGASRTLTVKRAALHSDTVKLKIVAPGIAWLRVSHFQDATAAELVGKLVEAAGQGVPTGVVLDLRHDPGGVVRSAVGVAAAFLAPGSAVFAARGRDGDTYTVHAEPESYAAKSGSDPLEKLPEWARSVPLTVLVNGGSASASELVAGALQDNRRATVLGSQTFGKGSIQSVFPLAQDAAIKMTVARYYTPNGRPIQATGLAPDIVIASAGTAGNDEPILAQEADLPHHLPAEDGLGDAVPARRRATIELNSAFGTREDHALQSAVALLSNNGRPRVAAASAAARIVSAIAAAGCRVGICATR